VEEHQHTITGPDGETINVVIRRDKRLKKSSRWERGEDGTILVRVPQRLPKRYFSELLDDVSKQLAKKRRRAKRRTDADLQRHAQEINRKYFKGELKWEAIRWVGNMKSRLGSCTTSGSTQGHIRISDKIKHWPAWVIDYLIAHELTHTIHPNHSQAFWDTLTKAYPLTERARGFVRGVGFVEGLDYENNDE
jgi:predicted metal-dependent hydrolase